MVSNEDDVSTTPCVEVGIKPVRAKVELSTTLAGSFTPRMAHTFTPELFVWCIGQVAWSPSGQVQSSADDPLQTAIGAAATDPS